MGCGHAAGPLAQRLSLAQLTAAMAFGDEMVSRTTNPDEEGQDVTATPLPEVLTAFLAWAAAE
jgi:hypothetical protein